MNETELCTPLGVCYESVEAALVFFVDEEFVYAFHVMLSTAGNHQPSLVLQKFLYCGSLKNFLNFEKRFLILRGTPAINPNTNYNM